MNVRPDPNAPSGKNYELTADEMAAGYTCAFMTGPIGGTVALPDGTAYDVGPDYIPVKAEHVGQLHLAIHKAHHAAGRFTDVPIPDHNYGVPQGV